MYIIFLTLFSLCLAPVVLLSFEDDHDFLTGELKPIPPPPQSNITEGTIEEVTGDGDTYDDEQSDDGDWYYGMKTGKKRGL